MDKLNKKGVSSIVILLSVVVVLLIIYLVLLIPIPVFKLIRSTINFFLVFILWFLIQAILIYFYYIILKYSFVAIRFYKTKINNVSKFLNDYLVVHI